MNYIYYAAMGMIIVALFVSIVQTTRSNKVTSAYSRVNNCVLSIANLTQKDVENCHKAVQEDTGITLKRYDK